MTTAPVVAHVKDHFLPLSETFIYTLIRSHRRYRPIVLDRHARRHAHEFPLDAYYSPVIAFGPLGPMAGILERLALRVWKRSPYLERVMRHHRVRLLHVHFGQVAALFVPIARRLHIPLVSSFYGKDVSVFAQRPDWRHRFRSLWTYGDAFLVLGPRMAEQLAAQGCPEEKIHILPLALNLQHISPKTWSPLQKTGATTYLLTVGRLVPKKGTDVLLRAFAHLPEHTHLWIIGDGPQRAALEHLTRALNLAHRVTFLGWRPHNEVLEWMQRAHIFVLPSRTDPESGETEGTPTVLLEAQSTGLPVVATYHADIPFIVEHGRTGLLVPEGDEEALARALNELCNRPERWAEMGRAGREQVGTRHSASRVIQRLESMYDMLIRNTTSTL